MHLIKRSLRVLPLALVAASLTAPAATAHDPATATCTFTGLAPVTPPVRPFPETGGGGEFRFAGSATCELTHGGASATVTTTMSAAGAYTNVVCGTGTATGHATITFPPNATGITSASAAFSITFVAGVGEARFSRFDDNLGHRGQGDGEVTIVPSRGSCTAPPGVSDFYVYGGFTASGVH